MSVVLVGCTPQIPDALPSPARAESTPSVPSSQPVVLDDEILAPDRWILLPDETAIQTWKGQTRERIDLPVDTLTPLYVMYATCSGGASMTVHTTTATSPKDQPWEIDCDSVPNRREVHTDESTRTESLSLTVEGEGPWGFVLATSTAP